MSIALDFRSGNEAPYPASVADINYAVRWAKLNARALKTRPDLVGLSGQSSGGHLAMLVAMRPHDPRYAAIPLPAGSPAHDASVRCVVMSWPVINPFSRYRLAKRELAGANPPEWPKSIIARHDAYWRSEANMAEGNPMLALERGEAVLTPPAIWFQGRGDRLHDYKDAESSFPGNEPQRFVDNYRKAGGEITLEYIDAERHTGHSPDLSKTGDMFERMVAFVGRHIEVELTLRRRAGSTPPPPSALFASPPAAPAPAPGIARYSCACSRRSPPGCRPPRSRRRRRRLRGRDR